MPRKSLCGAVFIMFDISELSQPIQQFDEGLWLALVDRVLVYSDGRMVFQFTGGFETAA